jgi:hypothetical protein
VVIALVNAKSPARCREHRNGAEGTKPELHWKEVAPLPKVQDTCAPWCASHDDEIGRCVTDYRFTPLTLETPIVQFGETRPAQMHTVLETSPDGAPVIVTFASDGTGTTLTPAEALAYAAQLSALARIGLGVA